MSKDTDRATPRPWAVCDDRPDGELCIVTGDEHRLPIALVDTQNTGDAQATADAALIVAAVNAHDALVAACEAALAAIGGIGTEDQGLMNVGTEENPSYETAFGLAVNEVEIDDAIELVKAALALARGE